VLRLGELYEGLQGLATATLRERAERAERRAAAVAAWRRYTAEASALRQRAATARTSWLVADFADDPARITTPAAPPETHTVVATDGSQILPDRHQAALCYVLNLGRVVLRYGPDASAALDSAPALFADETDLYHGEVGERRAVTGDEVSAHRTVWELEGLLALATEERCRNPERPLVAVADGTLIPWSLDREDPWYRDLLDRYLAALAGFAALDVAPVSYISRSGASDVVHLVRLGDCDQTPANCDACAHLAAVLADSPRGRNLTLAQAAALPCGGAAGLCDADLFGELLAPGEYSAVFCTRSKAFARAPEQRVAFCYYHTGQEIARLETPLWATTQPASQALVQAVVADQVRKGRGYPVALQEAHEQAVVRAPDRAAFERVVESLLVQRGAVVRWSAKGRSKQIPGV